jgi:CRP-like cAMP-binding protein
MSDLKSGSCFDTCGSCQVRGKSLFAGLARAQVELLSAQKSHRPYRKGEIIFEQGAPSNGIFCIGAGSVKVSQKEKGKSSFVRLAAAGDSVGHRSVFTSKTFRGRAVAAEGTHLCFVPRAALHALLDSSAGFSLSLIRRMARDLELTENSQKAQREKTVSQRAAALLLQLKAAHGIKEGGGAWLLDAPITRADLATMLGVANESVLRTLSAFRKAGWIASGTKLRILDAKALRKACGPEA